VRFLRVHPLRATESGGRPRPLVLFETAFGRIHHATGAFIDFSVRIDTPLDVALSRACLVFLGQAANDHAAARISWPGLRATCALYGAVGAKAAATADLVLDGTQAPIALAQVIADALVARGVRG
jgi:hypothetical protein